MIINNPLKLIQPFRLRQKAKKICFNSMWTVERLVRSLWRKLRNQFLPLLPFFNTLVSAILCNLFERTHMWLSAVLHTESQAAGKNWYQALLIYRSIKWGMVQLTDFRNDASIHLHHLTVFRWASLTVLQLMMTITVT